MLNMEDSWVCLDDDDSSNCSLADSDKIDSETEAELYSRLHHEPNLSFINSENINEQPSGLMSYSTFEDIFCNKRKSEPNLDINEHPLLHTNIDNFSNDKRKSSEMDADSEVFNENLSSTKKPKVESMSHGQSVNLDSNNYKNINDSSKLIINNVQDKNTVCISYDTSIIKKETIKQQSSDSDTDIWIDEISAEKSDLKINLLKETDTIFLSSDSDNEFDISSPFQKRDSFLRNLSMPNIKTEESPKGLWHINFEDQHRSKKQSHRYHNFDIACSNCNKKGHTFRACPSPRVIKCFICGGNHMGFRCPKRICSNCHIIGHDRRNCQREIIKEICHVCNLPGHAKMNCPDIWRRYHLTTNPSELRKGKQVQQNTNLYCWNCGKCGHFGTVCQFSHLSVNQLNTLPCVISYDHPKPLLKNRLAILKKYSYLSFQSPNKSTNSISNASSKQNDHLRHEYTLNVSGGSNGYNRGNKRGRKKFGTAFRFDKVQDIVSGKDFPRTKRSRNKYKRMFPVKSDEGAESPQLLIKLQLRSLRKRWNQERKKYGKQAFEFVMQDDFSRALWKEFPTNLDADLPESVRIQVEKGFRKWRNRKWREMKQKYNKGRELT